MKFVATFSQPTSVVDCFCTTLTDGDDVAYLAVARPSIVEIFAVLPDALALQCKFDVWGRIVSLHPLPVKGPKHHILALTDHPDPRVLVLGFQERGEESKPVVKCLDTLSLYERNARPAEFFNRCIVDRKGRAAVVSTYAGKLRVIELEEGRVKSSFDVAVRELNILSMCFTPTVSARPLALAILHRDHRQTIVVTSHDINISSQDFSDTSPYLAEIQLSVPRASSLVPVPASAQSKWNTDGGIMVFVESHILFYSLDKKRKKKKEAGSVVSNANPLRIDWPYSEIVACTQSDAEGVKFLLGDAHGQLAIMAFDPESARADVLLLGQVSPPTAVTMLSPQFVYIGSHFGDAQLVRIVPDRSSRSGNFLETVETYRNTAPIMDAILDDIDGSGQSTIVTCSGSNGAGSLRVVRTGANFTEGAHLEGVRGACKMWALKRRFRDEFHAFLLVSTHTASRCISLPEPGYNRKLSVLNEFAGLKLDAATLAASNVLQRKILDSGKSVYEDSAYFIQVTQSAVLLLETSFGNQEDLWMPEGKDKILIADISPSQVCVALTGGKVVLLQLHADRLKVQSDKQFFDLQGLGIEISSLSFSYPRKDAAYSTSVVLGFWSTHEVKVLSIPSFTLEGVLKLSRLPRSSMLYDFGNNEMGPHNCLMIGTADGTVVYSLFVKGAIGEMTMKTIALGDSPISLNVCVADRTPAILASGSRNAIFTWNEDTINHSPLLIKEVSSACYLHTPAFKNSIVMSLVDGLVAGRVQELDKLHIRTIPLGSDDPYRIAYMQGANALGIGCIREESEPSAPVRTKSTFKIIDSVTFEARYDFHLDAFEEVTAVSSVKLGEQESTGPYFTVGSVYLDETEREPSRGRLLVFSRKHERFQLVSSFEAHGSVHALTSIHGRLVAAINTSVVVFALQHADDYSTRLVKVSDWNHNYIVTNVAAYGNYIVTGDAVASLAILQFANDTLTTVARDYAPLWPLCFNVVDNQAIVGANSDSNLFSFKLIQQGDRKVLERDGFYYFGETVNKVVSTPRITTETKLGIRSSHMLFTSSGRISMVIELNDDTSRLLFELERNMSGIFHGPGNLEHGSWRAPTAPRGRSDAQAAAVGFLDGDFLERFLDYPKSSPQIAKILAGKNEAETLKISYEDLRIVLEALRSMH